MGTVDKIYLEFKKPFWDANFHGFSLLWNKMDHTKMLKNEQFQWLVDVLGFYPVDYQPSVLCGWISGNNAIKMEMLSDAVVQEGLLMLMRIFLTSYNIPEVIRLER
jgi:spermine oxidase